MLHPNNGCRTETTKTCASPSHGVHGEKIKTSPRSRSHFTQKHVCCHMFCGLLPLCDHMFCRPRQHCGQMFRGLRQLCDHKNINISSSHTFENVEGAPISKYSPTQLCKSEAMPGIKVALRCCTLSSTAFNCAPR